MKVTFIILFTLSVILYSIYYFTGYKSAFEADQSCHYEMSIRYADSSELGCDHDLETRQWILFEKNHDSLPASVLKRFRY